MKREYTVKYYVDTENMINGKEPHSEEYESLISEAESAEEAIELAKDYLREQAIQNSDYTADIQKGAVIVMDDAQNIVERYYSFSCTCTIQEVRKKAGLSRAAMSRLFEIPIRTLENWEAGGNPPTHWAEKLILEKLDDMCRDDAQNIVERYYSFSCTCTIQEVRKKAGLSRAAMSRLFEIPIRTLENWEARGNPPAHWAEKLILEKLDGMCKEGGDQCRGENH